MRRKLILTLIVGIIFLSSIRVEKIAITEEKESYIDYIQVNENGDLIRCRKRLNITIVLDYETHIKIFNTDIWVIK